VFKKNAKSRTMKKNPVVPKAAVGQLAQSLPTMVAGQILKGILDGTLAPGARLTEIELAAEHAVSRATVREALAQLERQRFVERVPRYGARVAAVSKDEVLEIYQLRAVVFGLACRLACESASADDLKEFDAAVKAMEALAKKPSTSATTYMQHSVAAQQQIITLSRSRWIADIHDQLTNLTLWLAVIRQTGLGFTTAQRRRESAIDWRRMATALQAGDAQASEAAARALLAASGRFVWERFKEVSKT
jgi:DNA-binding GntR family transcriptional regulator